MSASEIRRTTAMPGVNVTAGGFEELVDKLAAEINNRIHAA